MSITGYSTVPELPPGVATITLGNLASWIVFLFSLLFFVMVVKRKVAPTLIQLRNFLSDWAGESERPGFKRKMGVMERLSSVEYQFHPNGGNSFHDKLHVALDRGQRHEEKLEDISKKLDVLLVYLGAKDENLHKLIREYNEDGLH